MPAPETPVLHVRPTPRYLVDARFQLKYAALLCGLVLLLLLLLGVLLWRAADTAATVAGEAVGQAEQLVREQQASARVAKVNEMAGAEDPTTQAAIEQAFAEVERKGLANLSEVTQKRREIEVNRRRMRVALGGGGLVLLLLVAIAGLYITRRVTAPAFKLERLLRKVGTGRLVVRERPNEHEELRDLFDTFVQMTHSLRELQIDWLRTIDELLPEAQAGGDAKRLEARLRELRDQLSRGVGEAATVGEKKTASGFHPVIQDAVITLCKRFEAADYGVTPIIDLAALVANADGKVDPEEEAALLTLFRSSLDRELSPEMVRHLVRTSLQVVEAAGAQARAQLLAEVLLDCDAVEPGLLVALTVAFASEGLSSSERAVIQQIAQQAGVKESRLEELIGVVERACGAQEPQPSKL